MARYIDAEAFKRKLIDEKSFFPTIVARALEEMPTADVVEVPCRCKDCKYYTSKGTCDCPQWLYDDVNIDVMLNDFCSYGERRDK